jgi:hypothetical protein
VITTVLSGTLVVLGVAIVVRTLAGGTGGGLGLLLGSLFVLAGVGRLYVQRRIG